MATDDTELTGELAAAYDNGQRLAELIALFNYFWHYTPEGQQVRAEIERDWQATCQRLRADKRLIGAEFSLESWLVEVRRQLLSDAKKAPAETKKPKSTRPTRVKGPKFRGIK